jgi:hypothetical protein
MREGRRTFRDAFRAPRKISFDLPRLASEVSDSKGLYSGTPGGSGIFRGALYVFKRVKNPIRQSSQLLQIPLHHAVDFPDAD